MQQERTETYEELVERIQNSEGDERQEAFEALVAQFSFAAQSWAYQTLGDFHTAQDVVQEALITAYEKLDELRDPAAFPGWLRRIVWTHCSRRVRQSYEVIPLADSSPAADDPATDAEQRILNDRVRRAVQALPEHERIVTELFYLNDYSIQEIAERLHVPLTTVKKRLQYAREHLREIMPPQTMSSMLGMRRAA
jgi:RNA polymerase sigma factor (sigma-70 family)